MSLVSTVVVEAYSFVAQTIPNPPANAPTELRNKVNTALGLIKWASLMAVLAILLAAGTMVVAGDRGFGGGISPELKSKMIAAGIALVIIGSASQIVTFLS